MVCHKWGRWLGQVLCMYMLALRRLQGASLSPQHHDLGRSFVLPGSLRTGAAPRTTPRGSVTTQLQSLGERLLSEYSLLLLLLLLLLPFWLLGCTSPCLPQAAEADSVPQDLSLALCPLPVYHFCERAIAANGRAVVPVPGPMDPDPKGALLP